jgi:hypothetical protein
VATQIVPALVSANDQGMSLADRTAPLSAEAAASLAKLERAFLPLHIVRAVTRYEIATARYDELVAKPASELKPAEVDAFGAAQQTIADAFGVLAEAKRLDLIAPAETATRYRQASAHCRELSKACSGKLAYGGEFSDTYNAIADARDEMRDCLCRLEAAGRLDLVGGA